MSKTEEIVYKKVLDERERQNEQWGIQIHDDEIWALILGEEFGELQQAILHNRFGGNHAGTLEKELIHVTAVAFQWLESKQNE